MGDQPIETAPDDRPIWVFNAMTGWYTTQHINGEWPLFNWGGQMDVWYPRPTLWRPLDAPPARFNAPDIEE